MTGHNTCTWKTGAPCLRGEEIKCGGTGTGPDLCIHTAAVSTVESPRPPDYPAGEFRCVPGSLSLETSRSCLNCP